MPRIPINYQNTIIYKIVCNDLNIKDLYVGYTTDFKRRKSEHKLNCNNINSEKYNMKIYKTIRENGNWDNWSMIEIEKYPCNDSKEATARERYWFETLQAKMNSIYPQRSDKEYNEANKHNIKMYYETNKDKILEYQKNLYLLNREAKLTYQKQYSEENKDKIKEYKKIYRDNNKGKLKEIGKQKMTCECGSIFRQGEKARHYKTIKHKSFIEQQNSL